MKNSIFFFLALVLILGGGLTKSFAQDFTGGQITYEQIIDYQLEGVYDHPSWDSYIADLPKKGKSVHVLSFTTNEALYQEDLSKKAALSKHLSTALDKANYAKGPQPEIKQTYYDFTQQKRIEQLEFMTRSFQVESDMEPKAWKLSGQKKKVLDYVCMGADLTVGEETITAWFSPRIPVSAGPGRYHGLPGLILGLEKNGEVFLLATSIDFTAPQESLRSQLNKGQKISREKFDQVVEEKLEEYRKIKAAEKSMKGKSKKY
jgi:GLPGLI family protein